MSAEALPYRLRPNKAVDRRLFMELLNRCQRWIDLEGHVYVSMAAAGMEDQKLVHRLLGIKRLLAFDMMPAVVERQRFNAPVPSCRCVALTADAMTADIESEVVKAGISDAEGYIVWLDYTAPRDLVQQIKEFEKLVSQLAPGDIVRVTVNANYNWWAGAERDREGRLFTAAQRQATAFDRLRKNLGMYMSDQIKATSLGDEGVAIALAQAFGKAAGKAVPARDGRVFEPLSITRYADGQQMLSVTGMVTSLTDRADMRAKIGLNGWPFGSANWGDVKYIAVADLTTRERLFLERNVESTNAQIAGHTKFDFDSVTGMPGFLDNFRQYYRFYPAVSPVEL